MRLFLYVASIGLGDIFYLHWSLGFSVARSRKPLPLQSSFFAAATP